MFFGAISTDIKKSSTLWANLPQWMQTAVNRTNNITEYIINMTAKDGIKQTILPNSPEGDAWTVLYECSNQEKLKEHVKHVAQYLKHTFQIARNKFIIRAKADEINFNITEKMNKMYEGKKYETQRLRAIDETLTFVFNDKTPFYREIYVRIGVAFSDDAPIEYEYTAKTDKQESTYTSYWNSVVKESERAEAEGPWKSGIGVTQAGEKVKHVEVEDKQKEFKVIIEPATQPQELFDLALNEKVYDQEKNDIDNVNGYMIFVHYHLHIQMEDVKKNPHLYKPLVEEFFTVHKQTVESFDKIFEGKASLVKVKRNSDSMFFIQENIQPSQVWNGCLPLCAALPVGSSIGIAFTKTWEKPKRRKDGSLYTPTTGSLKRLTSKRENKKVDYFGDCVNLAARMESVDWRYPTQWFTSGKNDHQSRVAMCSADNTTQGWSTWVKPKTKAYPGSSTSRGKSSYIRPFTVEDIPRPYLNAGREGQFLRVISSHVYLNDTIRPGDTVWWEEVPTPIKSSTRRGGRRGSIQKLNKDERETKEEEKFYGRVVKSDFLFIDVKKIDGKPFPGTSDTIRLNVTGVTKCPQKELTPEAEELPEDDKNIPHIKRSMVTLKF